MTYILVNQFGAQSIRASSLLEATENKSFDVAFNPRFYGSVKWLLTEKQNEYVRTRFPLLLREFGNE